MIDGWLSLIAREWRFLLFGLTCTFLSGPGQTFFIGQFTPHFGAAIGLGPSGLGMLYMAATLSASVLMAYAGQFIDRIDLGHYLGIVATGLALACLAMALASGMVLLFFALLLLRLTGQGLMGHIGITAIARYYDRRRGRALAIVSAGYPLSEGLMPPLAAFLIATFGWRPAYGATGLFVLGMLLLVLLPLIAGRTGFRAPPPGSRSASAPRPLDGARIVLSTRFFWLALPALVFMPFASTALVFHIQSIAMLRAWPDSLPALAFPFFAAAHVLALPVAGQIIDRFGARRGLFAVTLPAGLGMVLLGLWSAEAALFAFLGGLGFSAGLAQTVVSATWPEVYGIERLGAVRSFAVMLMVAGSALGPPLFGLAIDLGLGLDVMSLALAALGMVASGLAVLAASRPVTPSRNAT